MAIIDVDVLVVDEKKCESIYNEVIAMQGPPDGTVIVTLADQQEFDDDLTDSVLAVFGEIGEIILVRWV